MKSVTQCTTHGVKEPHPTTHGVREDAIGRIGLDPILILFNWQTLGPDVIAAGETKPITAEIMSPSCHSTITQELFE